jgi:hypothetical protein
MRIFNEVIQGSEQWDALRAPRPTGSEYSKIFTGGGKVSGRREAYMRQLAISTKYKMPSFGGNKYTDRGHELEPIAREMFIEKTGLDVREVGFVMSDHMDTGVSPDGLIYHNGKPIGVIEIKCLNETKHLGLITDNKVANDHLSQVHGELCVTELPVCVYILYCPEAYPLDFFCIEVTPNRFTASLNRELQKFCTELEKNRVKYLAEFEVDKLKKPSINCLPTILKMIGKEERDLII